MWAAQFVYILINISKIFRWLDKKTDNHLKIKIDITSISSLECFMKFTTSGHLYDDIFLIPDERQSSTKANRITDTHPNGM